jgi:putative transposase
MNSRIAKNCLFVWQDIWQDMITVLSENKLAKLQRQIAKNKEGSKNWDKQRIKIARLYEKISNIRNDFQHKLSSKIINENQVIISEDLNVRGIIKNPNLAKRISDV